VLSWKATHCLVSLACFAVRNSIRQKHHPWFIATELGFLLVGVGSWLFHATLLYQVSVLCHYLLIHSVSTFRRTSKYVTICRFRTNLAVIWTTCIMAAMVWSWDVSNVVAYLIYAALTFAAAAITVIYMHLKDPTFHQLAYAFLTGLVLTRSIYLLHTRVDNAEARKNMWWTIVIGVSTFLTGFILWIIDNECCDLLRSVRHQIGIPWAFFLGISLSLHNFSLIVRTAWLVV